MGCLRGPLHKSCRISEATLGVVYLMFGIVRNQEVDLIPPQLMRRACRPCLPAL